MKPAASYDDICSHIARNYYGDTGQAVPPQPTNKVKMIGLLFARPDIPFCRDEIVPHLDHFHYRSGKHIDFFCAGYDGYTGRDESEGYKKVNKELDLKWGFSEQMFIRFVDDIEARSNRKWKYSGDCELLLANAHYDAGKRAVHIDLAHRVRCRLKEMQEIGAIRSVTSFFEDIVAYTEHANANDPTWGFSDSQGAKLAGSALRRLVMSLVPKSVREEIERAAHLAISDN